MYDTIRYLFFVQVFGALTSCALRPSEHFYGTGESLLFSFQRIEERRPSQPVQHSPEEGQKDEKDKEETKEEKEGELTIS